VPLERFLFALGIRRIGEQNAKLLARHYHSIGRWRQAMLDARIIGSEARESWVRSKHRPGHRHRARGLHGREP
jgi:NAD-dependent DNA ligase